MQVREEYSRSGELQQSLTVLRTALFGEAPSMHQADLEPRDRAWRGQLAYMTALLAAVRERVACGETEDDETGAVAWLIATEPEPAAQQDPASADGDGYLEMTEPLDHELIAPAVELAARMLAKDIASGLRVSEELLRGRVVLALRHLSDAVVDKERKLTIIGFRGVGPVDIVIRAVTEGQPLSLIECKWSVDTKRDKIYEGAWDAIKLVLASQTIPGVGGYLITAAPEQS